MIFKYIALTSTTALENELGPFKIMVAIEMFKGSIVQAMEALYDVKVQNTQT